MKHIAYYIHFVLLLLAMQLLSCIKNDIPYPVRELSITYVGGEEFTMQSIDEQNRVVTLALDEQCDIANVTIDSVATTSEATLSSNLIATFDLRTPIYVTLSQYQDYEWTICATQEIERYFNVAGQIGSSVIDADNLTATAFVPEGTALDQITITGLKLGAADVTTYSPAIDELTNFSSSAFRYVYVTSHGRTERWKLMVETTDVVVFLSQCDVWATMAWLTAAGDVSNGCGFFYRTLGSETWIAVDDEAITQASGTFSTQITGLTPYTDYEFMAYAGDDVSPIVEERTELIVPLTNGWFEEWYKSGVVWYPYDEGGTAFWASGNPGSTTLGEDYNTTTPTTDLSPQSTGTFAAQLQSRYVLVKFAAGNLFTGKFVKTAGTNGIVAFGQPFTARPIALRGWAKYNGGIIDKIGTVPSGVEIVSGTTLDVGVIYIALGTWTPQEYGYSANETEMLGTNDSPIIIDTRDQTTFFDPSGKDVVAYGEMQFVDNAPDWVEFTIPLTYTSYSTVPTHLVICCTASKYGDYFTGSAASTLYVDDFELIYE